MEKPPVSECWWTGILQRLISYRSNRLSRDVALVVHQPAVEAKTSAVNSVLKTTVAYIAPSSCIGGTFGLGMDGTESCAWSCA